MKRPTRHGHWVIKIFRVVLLRSIGLNTAKNIIWSLSCSNQRTSKAQVRFRQIGLRTPAVKSTLISNQTIVAFVDRVCPCDVRELSLMSWTSGYVVNLNVRS